VKRVQTMAMYVVTSALHHGFESHSRRHVFNNLGCARAVFRCSSLLSSVEPSPQLLRAPATFTSVTTSPRPSLW
jgi:hypothetical protein